MPLSFGAGVRDSLSNLAASLGTGRDKAVHDAFAVVELGRAQVESMYRGDWLARKVVDIVPYDSVRVWRTWSGHRADVARVEAAERCLGLRRTVQRAMVLGRLYGGGAGAAEPASAAGGPASTSGQTTQQVRGVPWLLNLLNPIGMAQAAEDPAEPSTRPGAEPAEPADLEPGEVRRIQQFEKAWKALEQISPSSSAFEFLRVPGAVPTEAEIAQLEAAVREAYITRVCTFLRPNGEPVGQLGTSTRTRVMSGGLSAAQQDYDYLSVGGTPAPFAKGSMVYLPYGEGRIILHPATSTQGSPAIDVVIPGVITQKLHYR